MKKFSLVLILIICFSYSCVRYSNRMNDINLQMNKQEVIGILGKPNNISAKDRTEYLNYTFVTPGVGYEQFFVRLVDGKVDAYGRLGDFDSTKPIEHKIDVKSSE